jgi:hypothetical protein
MAGEENILTLYCIRHQESVQNKQGFGEADTELTDQGRETATDLGELINVIGHEKIPFILTSDLKRTQETAEILKRSSGYKGRIIADKRLRAIFSGPLLERQSHETEEKYNLDKLKTEEDGSCWVHISDSRWIMKFDPVKTGIYPFNPLYCHAYYNKSLRAAVFPYENSLTPFEEIEFKIRDLHKSFVQMAIETPKPLHIPVVGSCSIFGFMLEYAAFRTIGINMFTPPFGTEKKPVFPMDHGEMMVLGYTRQDLERLEEKLRAVEGNIGIKSYIARLK